MKLTSPKIRALKWIEKQGKSTTLMGPDAPTLVMRTLLLEDGLIGVVNAHTGFLPRYYLTEAGLDVLAKLPTKGNRSKA
jgi:hypothetical protein